jgi:biotin operon repressor
VAKAKELIQAGVPGPEIARIIQVGYKALESWISNARTLGRLAPSTHPKTDWSDEMITELISLWAKGTDSQRIGEILGISRNAILQKVYRLRQAGILLAFRQEYWTPEELQLIETQPVQVVAEVLPRKHLSQIYGKKKELRLARERRSLEAKLAAAEAKTKGVRPPVQVISIQEPNRGSRVAVLPTKEEKRQLAEWAATVW